jgi:hypothetical protein
VLDGLCTAADVTVMLPPGDANLEAELRATGCAVEHLTNASLPTGLSALNFVLVNAENIRHGLLHPSFWRWQLSLQPRWKRPVLEGLRACARLAQHPRLMRAGQRLQDRWLRSLPAVVQAGETIDRLRPALVFSTNPYRPNQVAPAIAAAIRKVPTVTAIMSWDNLSYKGLPLAPFSRYLVWSDLMADEIFRSGLVSREQIHVTGTAQFDFHVDPRCKWTREDFFARIGGDPGRRLITFSTGAPQALPEEPELVELVWNAINRGDVRDRPQLLVRLHPHDPTDRFDALSKRCPGLLVRHPWASRLVGSWFVPSFQDLALLTNTLRHSDVLVNILSTMALDGMILDRPAVCPIFSTRPTTAAAVYLRDSILFGHIRDLVETGAVSLARNAEQLIGAINTALEQPHAGEGLRRRAVRRLCGVVDGHAGDRIAAAILGALDHATDRLDPAPVLAEIGSVK